MKTWAPRQQQMQARGVPEQLIDENFASDSFHDALDDRLKAAGQDIGALSIEQQRQAAWEFFAHQQGWSLDGGGTAGAPSAADIDAMLADPEARAAIAKILAENGHDLDALPPDQQREAARQVIQAQQKRAAIPDEQVEAALANQGFRTALARALADQGHDLDALEPDQQRDAARQLLEAMQQVQQQTLAAIPDEQVAALLSDPAQRQALADGLEKAGLDTPLDDLPREHQEVYARQFIAMRSGND